jgi:hypothetical protein
MPYRLELELPGLPKSANARLHWRARHKENLAWEEAVGWAVKGKLPSAPLARARLTCVRCSSVAADSDNVVAGFKPVIDALVKTGVLVNDKWENIGMPTYLWEKAAPKQGKVRVIVEEIE